MNLIDALEILKRPLDDKVPTQKMFLACGFTPVHLKTLLEAELRLRIPQKRVEIQTGLFGDLAGNIERLDAARLDGCFVVIEWSDLDPRLGIRSLGGWRPSALADIVSSAEQSAARLVQARRRVVALAPTVVCMPTLPLPPLFFTSPSVAGTFELRLHQVAAELATSLSELTGVHMVNGQALDKASAPDRRFDVKSEVVTGFPYTIEHAAVLAEMLARLANDRPAKKGLITDLDDTLWSGILGEDGVNGIAWDLEHRAHVHGLYQQFLASLAGAGMLIGAASKNDRALVDAAFERSDLLISRQEIFPLEVHWSQKSDSVKRILETWNVGADSVVFVDDSAMEAAEVKAALPEMECIVFPKGDYQHVWELLRYLRELFGKPHLTEDDSIRLESIRRSATGRDSIQSGASSADDFLSAAEAAISFDLGGHSDARAFELINKTNQFNLNGRRLTDSEWLQFFADPTALLLTASYEDKFGPLGKVAALLGKKADRRLCVTAWVMSCRAFSRRIEHQCLNYVFDELGVDEIIFDYRPTPRNGPLQDFLAGLLKAQLSGEVRLSREAFAQNAPDLFHRVRKAAHV